MYIPEIHHFRIVLPGPQSEVPGAEQQKLPITHHVTTSPPNDVISSPGDQFFVLIREALSAIYTDTSPSSSATIPSPAISSLRKRSGGSSPNTTIGVVVGILLTAFIIGVGCFLYFYRRSIRFKDRRRRRRHRKATSSKSSRSSDGSGGGGSGGGEAAAATAAAGDGGGDAGGGGEAAAEAGGEGGG
ncbi:hypothetical protein HD806DRAFT_43852 [Xylariaceae sp. AK1471]|nr:hypothetical protein HD806DRAFT_43852 [Xylariaceae sp. AK1471]